MKKGFDADRYLEAQSEYILKKIDLWDKLYLEFGGKLMYDMHAARCLPGYRENAKLELLSLLKDQAEIVVCIYAGDVANNKLHGDFGTSYDAETIKLIEDLQSYGLYVGSVVITRYEGQPSVEKFRRKLDRMEIKTYLHMPINGYPTDVDCIVSDKGYGANEYIQTKRPIVVVTAPGPGSGKLATCLSQLYHEHKRGIKCGYAKFETFPVWNLPLKHPLNVAYEAATTDLKDLNMLDSFHIEAYGVNAVNYNRDMEIFPVIKRIIEKITDSESVYKSPTDMGVNQIAYGIIDDDVVKAASNQEIIRRYLKTACDFRQGLVPEEVLNRNKMIMEGQGLKPEDRPTVRPAREYYACVKERLGEKESLSVAALQLPNGTFVTGRSSELMTAPAAAILNATKILGNIPDSMHLLPQIVIEPIIDLKKNILNKRNYTLNAEEILMALSISAVTNPAAKSALDSLVLLKGTTAHSTAIIGNSDDQICRSLGIDMTCDDKILRYPFHLAPGKGGDSK